MRGWSKSARPICRTKSWRHFSFAQCFQGVPSATSAASCKTSAEYAVHAGVSRKTRPGSCSTMTRIEVAVTRPGIAVRGGQGPYHWILIPMKGRDLWLD
jgi:hypothetical protein